jgi:hypothetical protein
MQFSSVMVATVLAGASAFAADPVVGTWVWNEQKTPRLTIKYPIEDLGGNRFALTGSTGQRLTIKADGVTIDSPFGALFLSGNWTIAIGRCSEKIRRNWFGPTSSRRTTKH